MNYQNLKCLILEKQSIDGIGISSVVWSHQLKKQYEVAPIISQMAPNSRNFFTLIPSFQSHKMEGNHWVQSVTSFSSFSRLQIRVPHLLNFFHLSISQSVLNSLRARTKSHAWNIEENLPLFVKERSVDSG